MTPPGFACVEGGADRMSSLVDLTQEEIHVGPSEISHGCYRLSGQAQPSSVSRSEFIRTFSNITTIV